MQTRYVAVCDKFGRRLKIHPIAMSPTTIAPQKLISQAKHWSAREKTDWCPKAN
jgi:hypothetical protein